MRFDISLQARMEQRMVLAPRMIQAMEILQLPLLALERRIEQELISNPVLEMRESSPDETPETQTEPAKPDVAETERELTLKDDQSRREDFARLDNVVEDWQGYREYFNESGGYRRSRASSDEPDPKFQALQNAPAPGQTLHEFLGEQLAFIEADAAVKEVAGAIIRNLDDNGYLRGPIEEALMEINGKGDAEDTVLLEQAEEALAIVQGMDPLGVGAQDLRECLLIQLRAQPQYAPNNLEVRLVKDHLHDIENNRYPHMSQKLGGTIEEIKDAVEKIRKLNPKPGSVISATSVPHIVPDIRIRYDERLGDYRVEIEDGRTPRLYIANMYRRMLRKKGLEQKTQEFIRGNIRSARWLIDAIIQRRNTLERVVRAIVKFQRDYFDRGPEGLKPLKMQQVADEVSLHVGTISRAVDDKYADTPWGIIAIRSFFAGGTENAEGASVSWSRVRMRLREMIDNEDKDSPLSDEEIVKQFHAEGIDLARRTVAKYRKILKIPASRRRRQF